MATRDNHRDDDDRDTRRPPSRAARGPGESRASVPDRTGAHERSARDDRDYAPARERQRESARERTPRDTDPRDIGDRDVRASGSRSWRPSSLGISRADFPRQGPTDRWLLAITLLIVGLGLVMVYSSSAIMADDKFHDSWYYFRRQAAFATVGLGLMTLVSYIPYNLYRRITYPLLGATAFLLLLVLIPGLGSTKGGATRWFQLGPVAFQPSELAKLALIFYLAYSLDKKQANIKSFEVGIVPHLLISGVVLSLILLEPDFGTTVTLGIILFIMMFLAGVNLTHLGYLLGAAIPLFFLVMMGAEYRMRRLKTFMDPWQDPSNAGFQLIQSWVALYNGGIFGQGLGAGKQKLFYLPEAHTDFVFSVLGEELGMFGVLATLGLYLAFVLRGIKIARGAADLFGCLLGLGITSWIGLQTLFNIAVVTGLVPTKGLVLPFMSYGGTSLMVALVGVGVLLNISRTHGRVTVLSPAGDDEGSVTSLLSRMPGFSTAGAPVGAAGAGGKGAGGVARATQRPAGGDV